MSEVIEQVKEKIREVLAKQCDYGRGWGLTPANQKLLDELESNLDQILSIPELAIVDREAKLPSGRSLHDDDRILEGKRLIDTLHNYEAYSLGLNDMGQDMLKEGWVREVKDG